MRDIIAMISACYEDGDKVYSGTFHADPLYSSTNIVAATTITGDAVCRATNVVYRLDTESAREFLADYVALP